MAEQRISRTAGRRFEAAAEMSNPFSNARDSTAHEQMELLHKYENYLFSIATQEMRAGLQRKFGPSDVVQQTYFRAVDNISDYRGSTDEQFRGWLRKILINQLRQNERDLHREKRDMRLERPIGGPSQLGDSGICPAAPELTDHCPTPSTRATAEEEDARLQDSLSRLSPDYQTVIKLRTWDRLPFDEIGKRMQRSSSSVQKLWYRAVLRLQQELGGSDE